MFTTSEGHKGHVGEDLQPQRGINILTYYCQNELKYLSRLRTHKGWKYYQGVVHNTYHSGNIETYHHVMFLMTEEIENQIVFSAFTDPGPVTLRGVMENDTTTRDKISFNWLILKKDEFGSVSMMLKEIRKWQNIA